MTINLYKNEHTIALVKDEIELILTKDELNFDLVKNDKEINLVSGDNKIEFHQVENGVCNINLSPDQISREIIIQKIENEISLQKEENIVELSQNLNLISLKDEPYTFNLELQPCILPNPSLDRFNWAICTASELVGQLVYLYGPKIGDFYQVRKVDITNFNKMPAWGIIIKKDGTDLCYVQWFGFVQNMIITLVPYKMYFIDYDSYPIPYPPAVISDHYVQKIGYAFDTSTLLFILDFNLILRHI